MDKIRYVTLFPLCSSAEIYKDVGMIPQILEQRYGYDSAVACYEINGINSNKDSGIDNLKFAWIQRRFRSETLNGIIYLIKYSKKIDVLNVYHLSVRKSILWAMLYKFLNNQGIVYLKLDMDCRELKRLREECHVVFGLKRKIFLKIDVVSAESIYIKENIQRLYGRRIAYIPDGFYNTGEKVDFTKKRKVFLTAGRLGTRQKATDILLQAFAKCAHTHDWNLVLAGAIEEGFYSYIENYYEKYPGLKKRVVFTGMIEDRKKLLEWYMQAKVFVLPSRWESFGIVLAEAIHCGCYVVVSDAVPSADEIISNGRYGQQFPVDDTMNLAAILEKCTLQTIDHKRIAEYADETFSWETIVDDLNRIIKESMNKDVRGVV